MTLNLDDIEFGAILIGCPLLFWLKDELLYRLGWKRRPVVSEDSK